MGIGNRVRAAHLSNPCPGGLGFPVTSAAALRADLGSGDGSVSWPDADDHHARGAGRVCSRCTQQITPRQQARCRGSGDWVHETCPAPLATRR